MKDIRTEIQPISVSPAKAAELLGCSRDHIYDLCRDRLIESAKSGSIVLVDYSSLLDYFESIRRSA